jgi:glycosyltransferase involved in cell wall biosynthesis
MRFIPANQIRRQFKASPVAFALWGAVKTCEAKIRSLPRLESRLATFLHAIQVNDSAALANAFLAGLGKKDLCYAPRILANIETFLNMISRRRPVDRPAASKVGPFRLLVIASVAPSPKHAGGLRLLDILRRLQQHHGYEVYLYSATVAEGNRVVKEAETACRFTHFADDAAYGERDLLAWLASLNLGLDQFHAIQFEWWFNLDAFDSVYESSPPKFITHQENHLRWCSLELNHGGFKIAQERSKDYLLALTHHACLEAWSYSKIPNHIVLTDADREFVRQFNPTRLEIIPTGLNEEFLTCPAFIGSERSSQLCFVGYFGHAPNTEAVTWFMEHVWPRLKPLAPGLKLIVVGSGDTSALRSRFAHEVEFTGEVASVIPYMQQSQICVAPLISGAGFRGKVNQYAILGKPIVATPIAVSGLPYAHEQSILLASHPEDFAQAILRLLADRHLAKKLAAAAQRIAHENYTWDPILRQLDNFYQTRAH